MVPALLRLLSTPHAIIASYGVQAREDVKLESDGVSISRGGGYRAAIACGFQVS